MVCGAAGAVEREFGPRAASGGGSAAVAPDAVGKAERDLVSRSASAVGSAAAVVSDAAGDAKLD
jgi:hypothetical protein